MPAQAPAAPAAHAKRADDDDGGLSGDGAAVSVGGDAVKQPLVVPKLPPKQPSMTPKEFLTAKRNLSISSKECLCNHVCDCGRWWFSWDLIGISSSRFLKPNTPPQCRSSRVHKLMQDYTSKLSKTIAAVQTGGKYISLIGSFA